MSFPFLPSTRRASALPAPSAFAGGRRLWHVLGALLLTACAHATDEPGSIGLVTKTETNPFFVKMKEGAERTAAAQVIPLLSGAGRSDGDNAGQVAAIENQVAAGARVILISPSDAKAIVPTITRLRKDGILVIALDSPADPMDATDGFFGTDNYRAGELIGAYAKARLGSTAPKAVTIDLLPGHPTGAQRHNGFLKGLGVATNDRTSNENAAPPEVVCSGDSVGDQAKAQTVMENCLQRAPQVNVVYAINEPSAAGAWNALVKAGREKDVFIVTVDGGCRGVADVAAGHFAATAQQYPVRMAELGGIGIRDRNFDQGRSSISIRVGRVYGAITARASAARRAAACRLTQSRASWAVRPAVPVGGRCQRGPIRRSVGTAAHATGPRVVAGRRGGRTHGVVGASADGRGARDGPRLVGTRVDGGLRGPACASRAARVRRCARIWSITDAWVMNATMRIAPWQVGHASGSTSKSC